jgi:hypothetical protein
MVRGKRKPVSLAYGSVIRVTSPAGVLVVISKLERPCQVMFIKEMFGGVKKGWEGLGRVGKRRKRD